MSVKKLVKTSLLDAFSKQPDALIYAGVTSLATFDRLLRDIPPEERYVDSELAEAGIHNILWQTWLNRSFMMFPAICLDKDLEEDAGILWLTEDTFKRRIEANGHRKLV